MNYLCKTENGLSGMVGHRVGNKAYACILSYLLHDRGLTDTGGTQQEYGALFFQRDPVLAEFVLHQICCDSILDLLFSFFYVHIQTSTKGIENRHTKTLTVPYNLL